MWPSIPEVLISPTDRYHYNSDGKPGVLDRGELAESVNNSTIVYNIERQPEIAIWPQKRK